MGHKSLTMTLRYSHLSPGHLLKAVNKVTSNTKALDPTATKTAIDPKVNR